MPKGKMKRLTIVITYDEGERAGRHGPVPAVLPETLVQEVREALGYLYDRTVIADVTMLSTEDVG